MDETIPHCLPDTPKKRKASLISQDQSSTLSPTKQSTFELLKPTLHVEARLSSPDNSLVLRDEIRDWLRGQYETISLNYNITGFEQDKRLEGVTVIEVTDYTGPDVPSGFYRLADVELDIETYTLHPESFDARHDHGIDGPDESKPAVFGTLHLPNIVLQDAWNSLIFDDALPSRLLRYMTRMVSMMKQPNLNVVTFNWNRLCLLHGPPGSGKSTLCRALAQKLSIRLSDTFPTTLLIDINTNALLSKYFGESSKLISATFAHIRALAQDPTTLLCIIIDEVESITSRREKATGDGGECTDSLRATNQLLMALDSLRLLPNVLVLCTSNLLPALDAAFLDRVDIKQYIPAPSPPAIYRILRSCLNELVRSKLVVSDGCGTSPTTVKEIPAYAEMCIRYAQHATSLPQRVSVLSQRGVGLSGRTLRRLPILALAMYTWGGANSLEDAVTALEVAVAQEVAALKGELA